MKFEEFELKRAMDTALREHFELQRTIIDHLERSEKRERALLAIFGEAQLQETGGRK